MASSRPLRAGSIAARAQQLGAVAPAGHPAHYGAGSIAADGLRGAGRPARRVIPPITGGLHCGGDLDVTDDGLGPGHPAHYGRAPLRPRPPITPTSANMDCHPAHYGRAPLRPPTPGRGPGAGQPVIPPITGGLHCGDQDFTNEPGAELRSSRPLRAGSIAARTRRCRPCRRPSHPAAAAEAVDVRQRWPGRRLVLADAPLARLTRIISRQAAAVAASNAPRTAT